MNHIFKTISKKIKGRANTTVVVSENASSLTKTTDNRSHQQTTSHPELVSGSIDETPKLVQGDDSDNSCGGRNLVFRKST